MELQLDQPLWLLLLPAATVGLFLFWKSRTGIPLLEKRLILTMRSLIFLLIILALAGMQILIPVSGVSTVFIADQSDSLKNQEEKIRSAIDEAAKEMKIDDKYGVVSTGTSSVVERPLKEKTEAGIQFRSELDTFSTDLSSGLRLGGSLIPSYTSGRVVLLSDGNENTGDAVEQAAYLKQQGLTVDVLPVEPVYGEDTAISLFELPDTQFLGETAKIEIELESNITTESRIRIFENEKPVIDSEVSIKPGKNRFAFQHKAAEEGFRQYRAEVITGGDTISENNEAFAFTNVAGEPKVLVVENTAGEGSNLIETLTASGLRVDVISTEMLPTVLSGYVQYQSIVFVNVPATKVTGQQMDLIHSAVKDFGTGFVMAGGEDSFGLGGYFKTPIEKLLPVDMELKGKKELPSLGMVIVLDRSGSMAGYKLQLAKEAAIRSAELLREKDTLGFIAFDDRPWQIIDTKPIGDKDKVLEQINGLTAGGGTNIFPSLELAYEQLTPLELQRKHIILLTDGQSATSPDYLSTIGEGKSNNITLSTVAIGDGADGMLLQELADEGGGRFYDAVDSSTIPSILSRETVLTTRTYIEDDPFYPVPVGGSGMDELFNAGIPQMNTYVATTLKGRADSVLLSEKEDPILARWQYGIGRTASWTSDIPGVWSGDWPLWEGWPDMWNQLITWTLPNYQNTAFEISQTMDGNEMNVSITQPDFQAVPMDAVLVNNEGEETTSSFRTTGPGKYEMSFAAQPGTYILQLNEANGEEGKGLFRTGISVPYSSEYRLMETNLANLEKIAEAGGGEVLTFSESLYKDNLPKSFTKSSIHQWLILAAFLLLFLEIALRRFGLAGPAAIFAKRKEKRTEEKQQNKTIKVEHFKKLQSSTGKKKEPPKKVEPQPAKSQTNKLEKEPPPKRVQPKPAQEANRSETMNRLIEAKKKKKR
ncbi:VWA domain-containing protein [Rossellomorea vietnamensis]|uniref:VWA domain-containing protein n=1 Tax=Rossellomorea vietnamensis TaxID=218284 RepID=A0A5D4MH15_9BACI|nr:VWA domain-containing protein [Rossellomorea vietnamensis]TYS01120.1 VWA domain-containing protein [Rossellomorea vietnamensis]